MRPNNAFKPNLLRSTKHMAEKACHVFGSATQVGLTQVLGCLSILFCPKPPNRVRNVLAFHRLGLTR